MDNIKEFLTKSVYFFLSFLYIGGAICGLILAFNCKSLVPIVASFVLVGFGVPTLVKFVKKLMDKE